MENTEDAVEVSNDILEKYGFLFCNDYVGPSCFHCGFIYRLGLTDVLQNIDEESELLQWLLKIDDEIIKPGFYHYAFALAVKN